MSATVSQSSISTVVASIMDRRETMTAESRVKAKNVLRKIPLNKKMINSLESMNDVDFTPVAKEKKQQRIDDMIIALSDAVDSGVESLEEFSLWLGLTNSENVDDIITTAHAYVRLAERNRPETLAGYFS